MLVIVLTSGSLNVIQLLRIYKVLSSDFMKSLIYS